MLELEEREFEIKELAENQLDTYYIYKEDYKIGTYNIEKDYITCFGFTEKDDRKLLRVKKELLDFVLSKKESSNKIKF